MFKMKSLLCIVAMFSLALVSCTETLPEKELPNDNGSDVITMIKATVEPLHLKGHDAVGNYSWNNDHKIGIYGTSKGVNERYLPVRSTTGDNEAFFFGNEVGGDLTVYMPYLSEGIPAGKEGRVSIPAKQQFYADPCDHLMYNSEFLANVVGDEVTFGYHSGLLQIDVQYDIQNIVAVKLLVGNISASSEFSDYCVGDIAITTDVETILTNGIAEMSVVGFPEGTHSEISNPLTLYAALAPGVYEGFVVEVSNATETFSAPVKGPFVVETCGLAEKVCVAKKVENDNNIPDFEGENGEFNPLN